MKTRSLHQITLAIGGFATLLASACNYATAQNVTLSVNRLIRAYVPGQILQYEMTGSNDGWEYQLRATDVTKKDDSGAFYEEIAWSDLHSNAPLKLSPASLAFRQTLSLDNADKYMTIPDFSKVQPFLIGPITDTLTFYSDVLLANNAGLVKAGQHEYVEHGKPNSWADGQRVLIGQDAIDFDISVLQVSQKDQTLTLLIQHVPPRHPRLEYPATWMNNPVANTRNNWEQLEHTGEKYIAQVGQETFDVRITLDLRDGKIFSASLHNVIIAVSRECKDRDLTNCGMAATKSMRREVSFRLVQ